MYVLTHERVGDRSEIRKYRSRRREFSECNGGVACSGNPLAYCGSHHLLTVQLLQSPITMLVASAIVLIFGLPAREAPNALSASADSSALSGLDSKPTLTNLASRIHASSRKDLGADEGLAQSSDKRLEERFKNVSRLAVQAQGLPAEWAGCGGKSKRVMDLPTFNRILLYGRPATTEPECKGTFDRSKDFCVRSEFLKEHMRSLHDSWHVLEDSPYRAGGKHEGHNVFHGPCTGKSDDSGMCGGKQCKAGSYCAYDMDRGCHLFGNALGLGWFKDWHPTSHCSTPVCVDMMDEDYVVPGAPAFMANMTLREVEGGRSREIRTRRHAPAARATLIAPRVRACSGPRAPGLPSAAWERRRAMPVQRGV